MKSLSFKRGHDGRFFTRDYFGTKQDVKTYLDSLAEISLIFNMLLCFQRFTAVLADSKIVGYTDKYGNKILHIY